MNPPVKRLFLISTFERQAVPSSYSASTTHLRIPPPPLPLQRSAHLPNLFFQFLFTLTVWHCSHFLSLLTPRRSPPHPHPTLTTTPFRQAYHWLVCTLSLVSNTFSTRPSPTSSSTFSASPRMQQIHRPFFHQNPTPVSPPPHPVPPHSFVSARILWTD